MYFFVLRCQVAATQGGLETETPLAANCPPVLQSSQNSSHGETDTELGQVALPLSLPEGEAEKKHGAGASLLLSLLDSAPRCLSLTGGGLFPLATGPLSTVLPKHPPSLPQGAKSKPHILPNKLFPRLWVGGERKTRSRGVFPF